MSPPESSNVGQLKIDYLVDAIENGDIGARYFREVGSVLVGGGPPDRARLVAVKANYGLVPAARRG